MIKVFSNKPIIHTVPLSEITINDGIKRIEFDDVDENRWRVSFKTTQAWRITTVDCFDFEPLYIKEAFDNGFFQKYIFIVEQSSWIAELKAVLKENDHSATFMDKANHYIFILGDEVVEIIAWDNFQLNN
ncbi:hypothetical protein [Bacillus sp. AFS017336]|uniref:hypothetical protein n=1 Tax=Bacillus sp. AFS017336 TaxID=2033489 RepID=UPI000BEFBA46|nr:hypothetical protein [Bacillus sp. AFS017336]PEL08419.1 hypothetical protein CN601_17010 [Bacillus sp. AFS017336]